MDEKSLIESLKKKSAGSDATIAMGRGEALLMLELLEKKNKKIDVLSNQVMELTQEMENIKSDFGNNR